MERPELGPVAVGDRLLVIRPYSRYRDNDPIPATVAKVARVWIDLDEIDGHRSWRLRLDTQDDGDEGSRQNRFVTPAQYEWEQRVREAKVALMAARAMPDFDSPWRKGDRLLALADFIHTYDQEHQ